MIKDAQRDLYSLQKYNKYCIDIFLIKRNFSRREIWKKTVNLGSFFYD